MGNNVRTRTQACQILGLSFNAKPEEIKAAYKRMVKIYHPDANNTTDSSQYNLIVEAYDFLLRENAEVKISSTKTGNGQRILGNTSNAYYKESNYATFEKQIKRQKADKAKRFEIDAKRFSEEADKREAEYENAMAAINAIRMAEALKIIIENSGK